MKMAYFHLERLTVDVYSDSTTGYGVCGMGPTFCVSLFTSSTCLSITTLTII